MYAKNHQNVLKTVHFWKCCSYMEAQERCPTRFFKVFVNRRQHELHFHWMQIPPMFWIYHGGFGVPYKVFNTQTGELKLCQFRRINYNLISGLERTWIQKRAFGKFIFHVQEQIMKQWAAGVNCVICSKHMEAGNTQIMKNVVLTTLSIYKSRTEI